MRNFKVFHLGKVYNKKKKSNEWKYFLRILTANKFNDLHEKDKQPRNSFRKKKKKFN